MAQWSQPHYVTVNRDLLLRFFVTFARFEFALKNTRFFRPRGMAPGQLPDAHPDWDAFASSIRSVFQSVEDERLGEACDYLVKLSPPAREVIVRNKVMWDTTPPAEDLPEIHRVLISVRRVRNNLFHGGKFANVKAEDAGRNTNLLEHSLVVLEQCLRLSDEVRSVYNDATL